MSSQGVLYVLGWNGTYGFYEVYSPTSFYQRTPLQPPSFSDLADPYLVEWGGSIYFRGFNTSGINSVFRWDPLSGDMTEALMPENRLVVGPVLTASYGPAYFLMGAAIQESDTTIYGCTFNVTSTCLNSYIERSQTFYFPDTPIYGFASTQNIVSYFSLNRRINWDVSAGLFNNATRSPARIRHGSLLAAYITPFVLF
jgi:hypothetical protein